MRSTHKLTLLATFVLLQILMAASQSNLIDKPIDSDELIRFNKRWGRRVMRANRNYGANESLKSALKDILRWGGVPHSPSSFMHLFFNS